MFIDLLETIATASFLTRPDKLSHVIIAIQKADTIKILLLILWESKSLDNKKYATLSEKIDEIGRMLGGWKGQLENQNSPGNKVREK